MKRNILVLLVLNLCLFSNLIAHVSTASDAVFTELTNTKADSVALALNEGDFDKAINLVQGWLVLYERLSSEQQAKFRAWKANGYYLVASAYSMEDQRDSALESLERAFNTGFTNYQRVLTDRHLAALRSDYRFATLVDKIRERGDYLYILRQSGEYSFAGVRQLPTFKYPNPDDRNLMKLRTSYKLDEVAGAGGELSKFIRLMRWVHRSVRHDGEIANPERMNALDLLAICKKENRGLGCRGLATILSESYLSLGFRSRILACMPKDTADHECHVVTIVYSDSLGKWLWMDPTNEAYLTDDQGIVLGPEEIRFRLIEFGSIVLNDFANLNNTVSRTKEEYVMEYLAKDLYWFESPLSSEYNYETVQQRKKIDYIRLYPEGFDPYRGDIHYNNGTAFICTTPSQFWQKPGL